VAKEANHPVLVIMVSCFKIGQFYNFGFYDDAESLHDDMSKVGKAFFNNFGSYDWQYFGALTHFQQYRTFGKRRNLKSARKWHRALERIQANGCPNVIAYVALLRAESLSIRKRASIESVLALYEHAIAVTTPERRLQVEANLNERAANFLVGRGMLLEAKPFFDRAIKLTGDDWGSPAMSDFLEEKCSKVMRRAPEAFESASPQLVGGHITF